MTSPVPRGPIHALDALDRVEAELLALLATITSEEWDAATIVSGWHVRHVVGHLLDGALRKLSIVRDGFGAERPASGSADDVRDFVNRLNAEGVQVLGRLSPRAAHEAMAQVSPAFCAFHRALDPEAPAVFPVSWAGQAESRNWFDTARELTERWHHQAQIRWALQRPLLTSRDVYHPVLDTFMRVLPFRYRDIEAPVGTLLTLRVDGEAGDDWQLHRGADGWMLTGGLTNPPNAVLHLPGDIAWRVFTKGIARDALDGLVTVSGDRALAFHALGAVAIVG